MVDRKVVRLVAYLVVNLAAEWAGMMVVKMVDNWVAKTVGCLVALWVVVWAGTKVLNLVGQLVAQKGQKWAVWKVALLVAMMD